MIEKLACKLGRKDEIPNIELAEFLCQHNDCDGIKEIVAGLKGTDRAIANDCIKVLYEIGERNPNLICDYVNDFISCLHSKNNRLVWGSMTALATIAELTSETIFERLAEVKMAYENGSVITIDNSISVFTNIYKANEYYAVTILPILINHLETCRPKEVPQHAERMSICFNSQNANAFIIALKKREHDLTSQGQTRINKLLKKLHSLQL